MGRGRRRSIASILAAMPYGRPSGNGRPRSARPAVSAFDALTRRLLIASALALLGGCALPPPAAERPAPRLDVVWVPSAPEVIHAMLELSSVGPDDVVYDLGCGDGEIVVAAARRGARGVGVDIDPERIANARRDAARAGVTDRVTFIEQDLFVTDVSPATVVTLYLLPELNERLRPKLLRELRPGTRVVSHDFGMGDWAPERAIEVPLARVHRVFLWRIPARASWRGLPLAPGRHLTGTDRQTPGS